MSIAPTIPDLYLMRHGETLWNVEGRLQGRLDSRLTARGRTQAAQQAEILGGLDCLRLSSPQGRAIETARIVFGGHGFATDGRLVEIDVGSCTGKLLVDLQAGDPAMFRGGALAWYDRAPGGERFAGVATRARAFLAALPGPAMIVTHGLTLRMLRLVAMNAPLVTIGDLPVEQGAVHLVRAGRHETLRLGGAGAGAALARRLEDSRGG